MQTSIIYLSQNTKSKHAKNKTIKDVKCFGQRRAQASYTWPLTLLPHHFNAFPSFVVSSPKIHLTAPWRVLLFVVGCMWPYLTLPYLEGGWLREQASSSEATARAQCATPTDHWFCCQESTLMCRLSMHDNNAQWCCSNDNEIQTSNTVSPGEQCQAEDRIADTEHNSSRLQPQTHTQTHKCTHARMHKHTQVFVCLCSRVCCILQNTYFSRASNFREFRHE